MSLHYDGPTLTLVVNPSAGRGRAKRLLPRVTAGLLTGIPGANLRVHQTTSFAEARLRCIRAVDQARPPIAGMPSDSLLVMGGDGMAHLGINACAGTPVPLGVIPAGTGNDFTRGAGAPTTTHGAVAAIAGGRLRRIDTMEVTGRLAGGAEKRSVGSILSTGYDAKVNRRTNAMRLPLGPAGYAYAALRELAVFEPVEYRLTLDGTQRDQSAMFVAVGNAGYAGGGMHLCPRARVDDGLLDVVIIHPVSRVTLLRLLPTLYGGGFAKDPAVEMLTARRVVVDGVGLYGMADGEELGPMPLTAVALPDSLSVYVGAESR